MLVIVQIAAHIAEHIVVHVLPPQTIEYPFEKSVSADNTPHSSDTPQGMIAAIEGISSGGRRTARGKTVRGG
ncbi:hypothetical protein ACFYZB_06740 [Streptomyces sp. NPDC001852]|uniref:hypothetical protein n=1 Tax=Streptomyces sp. NPDC001852 TaxID=3364619 RepID=UPI0036C7CE81